ncbi:putative 2OG-Fe(II) oxygenase [Brevundimonas sp. 2R-24]|uniref:2OG-Fe(II) oxygenase n=1 Tax=Peiella sedimenti TaxID=3061083 RepID=A0ABT8SNY2_9CAUL|nr:putative 2OG-Fe(II) oxygenase [Caulobacteraceae bacterium XZ-24]
MIPGAAVDPMLARALGQAGQLLQARRAQEAKALLAQVTARFPAAAEAQRLLGVAHLMLGDPVGAETVLAAAARLAPRSADIAAHLGEARMMQGKIDGAEAELRRALQLNPDHVAAARPLADLLGRTGRPEAAAAVLAPLVERHPGAVDLVSDQSRRLQALNRYDDAAALMRRLCELKPHSHVAWHNLASTLLHGGWAEEAEAAIRQAMTREGGDRAETWLVLARTLQAQDRHDEGEAALREALRRKPDYDDAHRDLAHLTWMRTGDPERAAADIDSLHRRLSRPVPALLAVKAKIREYAGDHAGGLEVVREAADAGDPVACISASQAALHLDPALALDYANRAAERLPGTRPPVNARLEALLALGEARTAEAELLALHEREPNDQFHLARLALCWRMLGDERYAQLYDYGAFVRAERLDTPKGWSSLSGYLEDLKAALVELHTLHTHPIGQSLRGGTQTSRNLTRSPNPAIQAFFEAADGPIRRYIAALGEGSDPLRRRVAESYRMAGIWSVRLKPNGFHADHVHPAGWISSACYIDLPPEVDAGGKEGWIAFGRPGSPTRPPLGPEHYIKPEPGLLALFPSYMWHGTEPFGGEHTRLTVAFDAVPQGSAA